MAAKLGGKWERIGKSDAVRRVYNERTTGYVRWECLEPEGWTWSWYVLIGRQVHRGTGSKDQCKSACDAAARKCLEGGE